MSVSLREDIAKSVQNSIDEYLCNDLGSKGRVLKYLITDNILTLIGKCGETKAPVLCDSCHQYAYGKPTEQKELSACCNAPMTVGGIGDFDDKDKVCTQYYVCSKCKRPCDRAEPIPAEKKEEFYPDSTHPLPEPKTKERIADLVINGDSYANFVRIRDKIEEIINFINNRKE